MSKRELIDHHLLIHAIKQPVNSSNQSDDALIGNHNTLGITSCSTGVHYSADIFFLIFREIKLLTASLQVQHRIRISGGTMSLKLTMQSKQPFTGRLIKHMQLFLQNIQRHYFMSTHPNCYIFLKESRLRFHFKSIKNMYMHKYDRLKKSKFIQIGQNN